MRWKRSMGALRIYTFRDLRLNLEDQIKGWICTTFVKTFNWIKVAPRGSLQPNKMLHREKTKDFVPEKPPKLRIPLIKSTERGTSGKTCKDNSWYMDLTKIKYIQNQ